MPSPDEASSLISGISNTTLFAVVVIFVIMLVYYLHNTSAEPAADEFSVAKEVDRLQQKQQKLMGM